MLKHKTISVCPVCLKKINAKYVNRRGSIYMRKMCEDHGEFETLIWGKELPFSEYEVESQNTAPTEFESKAINGKANGCPYDCGLCENHRQQVCCAVVEITNRCNQRCPFCFASSGGNALKGGDLTIDEIKRILEFLYAKSPAVPFNIQISGGEPTVRGDLPEIVELAKNTGFSYIQLNTNGKTIAASPAYARELKNAGVSSIFLQFDGMNDEIYLNLRGEPLLKTKIAAVENCIKAEMGVVLVPMVVPGVNDGNIGEIISFMEQRLPYVRGINFQPVSYFGRWPENPDNLNRMTLSRLFSNIEEQTGGRIPKQSFAPVVTGSALCSFSCNYILMEDGTVKSLKQKTACCCGGNPSEAERAFVANNWSFREEKKASPSKGEDYDFSEWDNFISRKRSHGFCLSGMAFQDRWNMDIDRLQQCRVMVATKDLKLIPLCVYNTFGYRK